MRLAVLSLIALTMVTPAVAQTAYRYVFPDGRVVFSDRPVPGAQLQSVVTPPPPAAAPAPAAGAAPAPVEGARWPPPPDAAPVPAPTAAPPSESATPAAQPAPAAPDRIGTFATAHEEFRAAERNLAAAKASRDAGQEPLPGERTGLARGGSRLNEAYHARQQQLGQAVANAQARLDRAVAERNAARF